MNGDVRPTVISLFAGCGGSSLGYRMAGYREVLAVDFDKDCEETFRLNFPGIPFLREDVLKVDGDQLREAAGIGPADELDVLDGSPPCQGFSMSGIRRQEKVDRRNFLFFEFVRLVDELRPRAFICENVEGVIRSRVGRAFFREVMAGFRHAGYKVRCAEVNAAAYGVPQARRRLIWLGARSDLSVIPTFPPPSVKRPVTVGEALAGVQNSKEDLDQQVEQRTVFRFLGLGLRQGRAANSIVPGDTGSFFNLLRLRPDRPAPTIIATCNLIHATEPRLVSIPEIKALQSFPRRTILELSNTKEK